MPTSPLVTAALAAAVAVGCAPDRLPGEGTGTAFSATTTSGEELLAEAAGSDIVLAQVGGHVITLEEFDLRLGLMSETARIAYERPERRPAFFETLVLLEMVARDAEAAGLAGSAYERVLVDATLLDWWRTRQWPDTLIPSSYDAAQIEAMFDAQQAALTLPERRSSRVVRWDDEADAQAARDQFDVYVAAGISPTVAFTWIAMTQQHDEIDDNPGYVPSTPPPEAGEGETDVLVEALFALEATGDVAGPIRTGRGWEIVQLVGTTPPITPTLEASEGWLRAEQLRRDRTALDIAGLAELRARGDVTVHRDAVAALVAARRGGDPADPMPRRFGEVGLAGLDDRAYGDLPLAEFDATAYETRRDLIAPAPPRAPLDGSGEGSGAPADPESL